MDFLREIIGDELYKQLETALNTYNGNEENKDKQVKLGNLGSGEYIAKGKYDGLQAQLTGKQTELDTANNLIADLKKSNKGNEELQGKVTAYETEIANLQAELEETKIKSAVKVALLSEKATEVDFLEYKLREKIKETDGKLELDENDNIKGWNEKVASLKTQYPKMFEASNNAPEGYTVVTTPLNKSDNRAVIPTKEQFLAMSYEERVALKQSNEQAYNSLAK